MSTHQGQPGHLGEAIEDLLQGRLGAAERAQAEAHLQACPRCRREFESLRQVKQAVAAHAARQTVPVGLGDAIARALDRERERADTPRGAARPNFRWALIRTWGFGLAAMAALISVLSWVAWDPAGLPEAVTEDFAEFQAGRLPLDLRTTEPRELERFFARGMEFRTQVFDLAMMDYRLAGGRIHQLRGRPSALSVYDGPGDARVAARVLCQMYEGQIDELPAATELLEHNGIAFRVYRKDGLTAVFWAEGKVICVLVSDLRSEDVIRLAFAKAAGASS
ncbi:MAG: zf-HC2 domain-containing protein [Nevskiaceae bacterium]